jgi:hypothetical protein
MTNELTQENPRDLKEYEQSDKTQEYGDSKAHKKI